MQRNEFPLELVYGSLTSSTNLFALRKSILIHCEKNWENLVLNQCHTFLLTIASLVTSTSPKSGVWYWYQ